MQDRGFIGQGFIEQGVSVDSKDDSGALKARLERLSARLSDLERRRNAPASQGPLGGAAGQAWNQGVRVIGELAGALAVGGFIGWRLDLWLGTTPALLIIFLVLGMAAGFWNLYRMEAQASVADARARANPQKGAAIGAHVDERGRDSGG